MSASGSTAEATWSAPGRLNLIGEHTDYNDGFVLPLALPYVATAVVRRTTSGVLRFRSAQRPDEPAEVPLAELVPGRVSGWAAYAAGPVWALADRGLLRLADPAGGGDPAAEPEPLRGLEIDLDSRVPEGAGLSSSAALECAVITAVDDLFGLGLGRQDLALLAQHAENDFVGVPTGMMDQMAAMLCHTGAALFLDTRTLTGEQVPLNLDAQGLALMVIDTRTPHQLVTGEYAARRRSCEEAAALLGVRGLRDISTVNLHQVLAELPDDTLRRRVRHVVTEDDRVLRAVALLRAERYRDIGPLLTASHASLRDDYQVTVPQLDVAVAAALGAGALGARMTGGGFGGCVLALVEAAGGGSAGRGSAGGGSAGGDMDGDGVDGTSAVRTAVEAAYAAHGFDQPLFFAGTPSQGAYRHDPDPEDPAPEDPATEDPTP